MGEKIDLLELQRQILSQLPAKITKASLGESVNVLSGLGKEEIQRAFLEIEKNRLGGFKGELPIQRLVSAIFKAFALVKEYDRVHEEQNWEKIIEYVNDLGRSKKRKFSALRRTFTDEDLIGDWNSNMRIKQMSQKYNLSSKTIYKKMHKFREEGKKVIKRGKDDTIR